MAEPKSGLGDFNLKEKSTQRGAAISLKEAGNGRKGMYVEKKRDETFG